MIHVVAGIINKNGKILICQRGEGGVCANLWEFPGGKLEAGETVKECLIRECKEELDVEIEIKGLFTESTYKYPKIEIYFTFFSGEIIRGKPKRKVHKDIRWIVAKELKKYKFCPANKEVIKKLETGNTY